MADLQYADIIIRDPKYTALAELSKRCKTLPISQIMTTLVDLLGDEFMPLLAEKWSVTGYDGEFLAENDGSKRALIQTSVELHRHKGTPWAIREVLRNLGFGEVLIDEGGLKKHNGNIAVRNGFHRRGNPNGWADYQLIFLSHPVSKKNAEFLIPIIQQYAPARCFLKGLANKKHLVQHNGYLTARNGEFNRGEKWTLTQKV